MKKETLIALLTIIYFIVMIVCVGSAKIFLEAKTEAERNEAEHWKDTGIACAMSRAAEINR